MFPPSRLILSVRPNATPALLVAAASIALHFAASPFLVPEIAARYGVALGTAGLISATQVGGFALANLVAGRRMRPRRSILIGSALAGVAANLGSALAPTFPILLGLRVVAGVAAGMITWLAWTEAMRRPRALRDVAGVGPLTALVGSPVVAWILLSGDDRAVFVVLALSCLPAAVMRISFEETSLPGRRKMSPSRSNVILLIALGLMTGAGSSLFIFAASIGQQRFQLDPIVVSLAFSLNAGAGLLATRQSPPSRSAPWWLALIAVCAVTVSFGGFIVLFFVALTLWGFAFWMAVPNLLAQVAEWSLVPEERTGDAQAIMAFGRMVGPVAGAALLSLGSFSAAGVGAAFGLAGSAALVGGVNRYRRKYPERRPVAA